jgi:hypothetical protein
MVLWAGALQGYACGLVLCTSLHCSRTKYFWGDVGWQYLISAFLVWPFNIDQTCWGTDFGAATLHNRNDKAKTHHS